MPVFLPPDSIAFALASTSTIHTEFLVVRFRKELISADGAVPEGQTLRHRLCFISFIERFVYEDLTPHIHAQFLVMRQYCFQEPVAVDFAVMDHYTARFYVVNFYKDRLRLVTELPDDTKIGVGIAVAKGNKEMLDKLNAALQNYRGTAAYYQMKRSYFGRLEE